MKKLSLNIKDNINIDFLAFTLAEVLITLGIIGIVATMTIPSLINNVQKQQYTTSLKKAYTVANQALLQMAADNGCVNDLKCTGLFDVGTDRLTLGTEFVKYFKVVKDCGITSHLGCFSDSVSTAFDGGVARVDRDADGDYQFITGDGIAFKVWNRANGCVDLGQSTHVTNNMSQICGQLYLDVNGPTKGPNNMGRDIFMFYITNGNGVLLYPYGGIDSNTGFSYWKNPDGSMRKCFPGDGDGADGYFCTGRIMDEGWEMNY